MFFKVVDAEVKSKNVQKLLRQILFDKLEVGDSFCIKTPVMSVNYLKTISSSDQKSLIKSPSSSDAVFILPSICSIANRNYLCLNQTVNFEVNKCNVHF